jgi:hypothetical protein
MPHFARMLSKLIHPAHKVMKFACIEHGAGVPVGPPVKFVHFAPPGKMHREACERMTHLVEQGLAANAIEFLDSEQVGGGISISTMQPCRI